MTPAEIYSADLLGRNMLHKAAIANDAILLKTVIARGAELDGNDARGAPSCMASH